MSREPTTADELDAIAVALREASETVRSASQMIRKVGMPTVLVHTNTFMTRYLPKVVDWAETTLGDARKQTRQHAVGAVLTAEIDKATYQARKVREAKKKDDAKSPRRRLNRPE